MKKLLFTVALVLTVGFGANAQRDGFFGDYDGGSFDRTSDNTPYMPTKPIGSTENSDAPLGSGLLVLATLGAGYALRKKREE